MNRASGVKFDAIVLAGGRSSRLGGVDKARLACISDLSPVQSVPLTGAERASHREGETLLRRACGTAAGAKRMVVVGVIEGHEVPANTIITREDPPYGGPAAAIGAGLSALDMQARDIPALDIREVGKQALDTPALGMHTQDWVLVLACDMPAAAAALDPLARAAARHTDADAVLARPADGILQPLLGLYRTRALRVAIAAHATLENLSVRSLIASLHVLGVAVPEESVDDVDTWDDAQRLTTGRRD